MVDFVGDNNLGCNQYYLNYSINLQHTSLHCFLLASRVLDNAKNVRLLNNRSCRHSALFLYFTLLSVKMAYFLMGCQRVLVRHKSYVLFIPEITHFLRRRARNLTGPIRPHQCKMCCESAVTVKTAYKRRWKCIHVRESAPAHTRQEARLSVTLKSVLHQCGRATNLIVSRTVFPHIEHHVLIQQDSFCLLVKFSRVESLAFHESRFPPIETLAEPP